MLPISYKYIRNRLVTQIFLNYGDTGTSEFTVLSQYVALCPCVSVVQTNTTVIRVFSPHYRKEDVMYNLKTRVAQPLDILAKIIIMSLITILLVLIVVGVLLWLINNYVPMDRKIKNILNAVVVIVVIIWLLKAFGLFDSLKSVHV